MNNLLMLFLEFFKTGLFAIGGGLATIPFLNEMAIKYAWFSQDELSTMIAISESTPGPMGVNMATYVGYHHSGIIGGIIATISLVIPSIIVICIIANFFEKFKEARIVKMIFSGIKPSVVAFILVACLSLFINTLFDFNSHYIFNIKNIIVLIVLFLISYKFKKLHPIYFVILAAFIGIIFKL